MNCSGYPYMPCSEMSSPASSSSADDAQAVGLLDQRRTWRRRATNTNANAATTPSDLGEQLVERAGVEQAALADGVLLGQPRRREEAAGERAPDAGQAVRGERADRVVDLLVDREHAEDDDHAGDARR